MGLRYAAGHTSLLHTGCTGQPAGRSREWRVVITRWIEGQSDSALEAPPPPHRGFCAIEVSCTEDSNIDMHELEGGKGV